MTKKQEDYDRRAEERFRLQAKRELFPKMEQSDMYVAIAPPGQPDAKFCLELGTAIMYDKPIITVLGGGRTLTDHLRRVSDHVVEVDDLKNADEVAERLQSIMHEIQERKKDVPP